MGFRRCRRRGDRCALVVCYARLRKMSSIVKLGLVLAILAALSALGASIYGAGKKSARAEYAERDNKALRAAIEEKAALEAKARATEAKAIADNAEAARRYDDLETEGRRKVESVLADLSATQRELRDGPALCAARARSAAAKAGTAARALADADAARLRRAYAEPFIRLAGECDTAANQRNEAVNIAVKDRERQKEARPPGG